MVIKCHFIRQKFVLGLIFGFSASYFVLKTFLLPQTIEEKPDENAFLESLKLRAPKSIKWQTDKSSQTPAAVIGKCKNTKQGSDWITDERGYTCRRTLLEQTNCCPETSPLFSCHSCQNNTQCCEIYEYCVSCCLRPEQKDLLEHIIKETTGSRLRALLAVKDQFELCQLKCRTSSNSVHLENKYKNSNLKYCYGHEPRLPY